MMFLAIEDQLNEYDNEFDKLDEAETNQNASSMLQTELTEKRASNKRKAKKNEPNINNFSFDSDGTLTLETINIKTITMKYYLIDAELLFSKSPILILCNH